MAAVERLVTEEEEKKEQTTPKDQSSPESQPDPAPEEQEGPGLLAAASSYVSAVDGDAYHKLVVFMFHRSMETRKG